ncbi:hypothetical protein MRX96_026520 [Rhipicephalus microplus]
MQAFIATILLSFTASALAGGYGGGYGGGYATYAAPAVGYGYGVAAPVAAKGLAYGATYAAPVAAYAAPAVTKTVSTNCAFGQRVTLAYISLRASKQTRLGSREWSRHEMRAESFLDKQAPPCGGSVRRNSCCSFWDVHFKTARSYR